MQLEDKATGTETQESQKNCNLVGFFFILHQIFPAGRQARGSLSARVLILEGPNGFTDAKTSQHGSTG